MPGGQYTNLKQQAQALGLIHRWEEIKDMYHRVSMMFGDLIKVTPSSKVVGDMALFMVQNDLTEEDVYAKGDILDFPASVVEFFEGRIGTPYQGFPEKLQKLVLKGRAPISERPGAVLPPVDFEDVRAKLKELEAPTTDEAVSAYCLYPKVFTDWVNRYNQFGDVSVLDTPTFFFGMTPGEVIKVEIEQGKVLVIKLDHISEATLPVCAPSSSNSTACSVKSKSRTATPRPPLLPARKQKRATWAKSALPFPAPLSRCW